MLWLFAVVIVIVYVFIVIVNVFIVVVKILQTYIVDLSPVGFVVLNEQSELAADSFRRALFLVLLHLTSIIITAITTTTTPVCTKCSVDISKR